MTSLYSSSRCYSCSINRCGSSDQQLDTAAAVVVVKRGKGVGINVCVSWLVVAV